MIERHPIETAPRDGTTIHVADPQVGEFVMFWNPKGTNSIFQPDTQGIWEAPDKSFTWSEERGLGPSLWRPLAS